MGFMDPFPVSSLGPTQSGDSMSCSGQWAQVRNCERRAATGELPGMAAPQAVHGGKQ